MAARNYTTAKGTELPLLNLRGREYLEVKYRLVWFREDHPDWSIETDLISVTDVSAYAKATIRDENGRVIATSHKFENVQGFPDFIEKAETGAIGRALALIGYGTQFCADELDEGSRIVDAPVATQPSRSPKHVAEINRSTLTPIASTAGSPPVSTRKGSVTDAEPAVAAATERAKANETEVTVKVTSGHLPGDYQISFGRKYKGKKLREVPRDEIEGYIKWLEDNGIRQGTPLSQQVELLKSAVHRLYPGEEQATAHS